MRHAMVRSDTDRIPRTGGTRAAASVSRSRAALPRPLAAAFVGLLALVMTDLVRSQTISSQTPTTQEVAAGGVVVRYQAIPGDRSTLKNSSSSQESGRSRAFALAELEIAAPMHLDGSRLEAGHYHLLCQVPPRTDPILHLVRFEGPSMLSGQMADLARVELASRPPIRFDLAQGTTPAVLRIGLTPTRGGVRLTVEYGNRRASALIVP